MDIALMCPVSGKCQNPMYVVGRDAHVPSLHRPLDRPLVVGET